MLEVCKGWVKGPFAGARSNDKVAPIPAVRRTTIGRLKSTLTARAGLLQRAFASARKRQSDLPVEPPMRTVVWRAALRRQLPRGGRSLPATPLIGLRPKRKV